MKNHTMRNVLLASLLLALGTAGWTSSLVAGNAQTNNTVAHPSGFSEATNLFLTAAPSVVQYTGVSFTNGSLTVNLSGEVANAGDVSVYYPSGERIETIHFPVTDQRTQHLSYTYTIKNVKYPAAVGTHVFTAKSGRVNGTKLEATASVRVNAPPTVTITTPAANAAYAASTTSITLSATVNDPDAGDTFTVSFVVKNAAYTAVFGPQTITANNGTFSANWTNGLTAGRYTFEVTATDNHGASTVVDSHLVIVGLTSLLSDKGTEISDGDNDANTKSYSIPCEYENTITVNAVFVPSDVTATELANIWQITGGDGTSLTQRTIDGGEPGKYIIECTLGNVTKKVTVYAHILILSFGNNNPLIVGGVANAQHQKIITATVTPPIPGVTVTFSIVPPAGKTTTGKNIPAQLSSGNNAVALDENGVCTVTLTSSDLEERLRINAVVSDDGNTDYVTPNQVAWHKYDFDYEWLSGTELALGFTIKTDAGTGITGHLITYEINKVWYDFGNDYEEVDQQDWDDYVMLYDGETQSNQAYTDQNGRASLTAQMLDDTVYFEYTVYDENCWLAE